MIDFGMKWTVLMTTDGVEGTFYWKKGNFEQMSQHVTWTGVCPRLIMT